MTIGNLKTGVRHRAGKAARGCIASSLTHCSPTWPSPRSQKHPCADAHRGKQCHPWQRGGNPLPCEDAARGAQRGPPEARTVPAALAKHHRRTAEANPPAVLLGIPQEAASLPWLGWW